MPITWNAAGDFADVVDGLEPVTLRRAGTLVEVPIAAALRFSQMKTAAEAGSGFTFQTDCVWQFEWEDAESPPLVGDDILDADDHEWTILQVERLRAQTRWRCLTRELT
jgi:hypothetical protein